MPAVGTFVPKPLPRADLDWRAFVPSIGRATLALARYDGILHGVRDPAVLLSPLTTQEAVLSSKIEGTQATLGQASSASFCAHKLFGYFVRLSVRRGWCAEGPLKAFPAMLMDSRSAGMKTRQSVSKTFFFIPLAR
jgi:hypothetical protein